MKLLKLFALILTFALILPSCTSAEKDKPTEKTKIRVGVIKGPSGMGMAKLMQEQEDGNTQNDYTFTVCATPTDINAKIIKGDLDIAAVPPNAAALLYNKNDGKVQIAAVSTLGILYVVEIGDTIKKLSDLNGKTIYASGKGAVPQYAFEYLLKNAGVTSDIIWKAEHTEVATLISSGEKNLVLLPEPQVTAVLSANKNARIALNLTEEWDKQQVYEKFPSSLIMGCVVVDTQFAAENRETVNKFLLEYKNSIEFAKANIDETAELIEKFEILPSAQVAKKALPNCALTYIDGTEMKDHMYDFLEVLYIANKDSIGGKLPDDKFYFR